MSNYDRDMEVIEAAISVMSEPLGGATTGEMADFLDIFDPVYVRELVERCDNMTRMLATIASEDTPWCIEDVEELLK